MRLKYPENITFKIKGDFEIKCFKVPFRDAPSRLYQFNLFKNNMRVILKYSQNPEMPYYLTSKNGEFISEPLTEKDIDKFIGFSSTPDSIKVLFVDDGRGEHEYCLGKKYCHTFSVISGLQEQYADLIITEIKRTEDSCYEIYGNGRLIARFENYKFRAMY